MLAKTYEDGLRYGRKCAKTMQTARRQDNERMVRESPYYRRESVTRGYWLGFVRAMRESS